MEKYLVFILLTLFLNSCMTPAGGCELNIDCARGLYCCTQIKSCRSSCDGVVCSSDRDCGTWTLSKCCSTSNRCTPIGTRCGSKNSKSGGGLSTGKILLIVFVPLGAILFCLLMAWLDKGSDGSDTGVHMPGGWGASHGGGGDCGGGCGDGGGGC